jgi:two-component system, NtrC family, sensor kinase
MSLRTKFLILVSMLALTISGSMGVALWSFGLQRSQLLGPYANTPEVLDHLRELMTCAQTQETVLVGKSTDTSRDPAAPDAAPEVKKPDPLQLFDEQSDPSRKHLQYLAQQGVVGRRTGTIASRTLEEKVEQLQIAGHEAIARGDVEQRAHAATIASEIRTLVSRLSHNVLLETVRAIETVEAVRRKLLVSVMWAFVAAALLAGLALVLVRRWVLRPVAELRKAAVRIAGGDFRHRVNAQGRDELAQLAGEVDHMAGMIDRMLAERVERERLAAVGEMVRRLAHNLRNPLAGIRGLAELTRDEVTSNPELKDAQERIIGSVDRFEHWLSDLLSVTKPLAVNPERAKVEPLLKGLVEAHRPMARTKEISLVLDMEGAPAEACFDPRHLEHSLVAILTNAIQASPAKSTVRISARTVLAADSWEVRIADQGPGVPADIVEKIFNAYFTTKKDGNGIGLAVAQQVVRAHGGRITVEHGLNGSVESPGMRGGGPGATFVVRIPVAPPPHPTLPPAPNR